MLQWDHYAPHMHSIYSQRMLYGLIFYWGDWNTFLFLYVLFCLFDHQTQFISRRIDLLQHTQHTTGKNSLNSFFVRSLFIVICLFVFFNFLLLWWCIWLHHRLGRNYVKTTSRYIEPTNEYFVFVSSDNVWRIRGWFLFHLSPRTHIHSIDSLMRINHNKISSLAGAAMLLARYATMFIWGNPT